MLIGIISDTHGFFDSRVMEIFSGVDHILHAGDVGQPSVLLELEQIAPVTAVLGNTDTFINCNLTEVIELSGRKFLVHHIVNVHELEAGVKLRIAREEPDVVVFGHTHKAFSEMRGKTLFYNPGYAGRPRFKQERSAGLLEVTPQGIQSRFIPL